MPVRNFKLSIIDEDAARRALLMHALIGRGRPCEPFDNLAQFIRTASDRQVLLVNDHNALLRSALHKCEHDGRRVAIIGYSSTIDPHNVVEAGRMGAFDYFAWPMDIDKLSAGIDACYAAAEMRWEASERALAAKQRIASLTRREDEILGYMVSGFSNRRMAEHLGISVRTVEIHRSHLIRKMSASNSAEAVRISLEAKGVG